MSEEQTPKRPAKRKDPIKTSEAKNKTVTVSEDAFLQVGQCAKKLKMSKSKFASAAIAFFAESGLDPTKERPQGLAGVSRKVEAGVAEVRTHNADIGNRLYALTRGFEKTLYQFMQQQQHATYGYIEAVEGNMLRYLVSLETTLLGPMIELLIKTQFEAYAGRIVAERALLEAAKKPASDFKPMHDKFSEERDQMAVADIREFIKGHQVTAPRPSIKPGATPIPAKPAAPATTSPPVTPKP